MMKSSAGRQQRKVQPDDIDRENCIFQLVNVDRLHFFTGWNWPSTLILYVVFPGFWGQGVNFWGQKNKNMSLKKHSPKTSGKEKKVEHLQTFFFHFSSHSFLDLTSRGTSLVSQSVNPFKTGFLCVHGLAYFLFLFFALFWFR